MPADQLEPRRRPSPTELRARGVALAALAAILVVIVAAATGGGFALGERGGSGELVAPALPGWASWVLVPLLFLCAAASLVVLTQVVVGRQTPRPARLPIWAQLATLVLVVLAVVALQQTGLLEREDEQGRPAAEASAAPNSANEERAGVTRSRTLGTAVTIVVALAFGGALMLLLSVLRRERGRAGELVDPQTQALLEGVDAGIEDLSSISDPRAAVIACYARLEAALRAADLARRDSEAPLEFLERVLVEREVLTDSAGRLTQLFERARFSPHDVDEDMRRDAIAALERARREMASPA